VKHKLKMFVRRAYARLLFHTGLHALVDRVMPRRLTILAGHCVTAESNAPLAKDMKIGGEKLARILRWLARRHEVTTVGAGLDKLAAPGRRSLVALSMDDGYRDNRSHLLPLLAEVRVPATVYLESRPLDERRVNWSHKFFFALDRMGPEDFIRRFRALCGDARTNDLLGALAKKRSYDIKRVLKYDAPAAERNRVVDLLFAEAGGDERALCERLYMTWDDARALAAAGIELGGHTVSHEILSRLDRASAEREVSGSRAALERALAVESASFAYPFGRRWDYNRDAKEVVRAAGFASAATTHAGTNTAASDRYELKRIMIDEDAELFLIAAEACGGFELLRRMGVDLSE
jgi:peptidoglycan/xylan/chitin deacetylase (PgdA/CDA1 family)